MEWEKEVIGCWLFVSEKSGLGWKGLDKISGNYFAKFGCPSVYFWNSETDPETGKAILHIVDGQQRITAIQNFVNGEFNLKEIIYSKKRANKGLEINIFLTYHPTKKKISGIINYLSSKLRET